jgi:3-deoxy-D-manno-octulosonate 8-phosphate phosphatase KdsC-like HAD superfamily phosphatase
VGAAGFVTRHSGGNGAVRELVDAVRGVAAAIGEGHR